jgi:hypothetical protein
MAAVLALAGRTTPTWMHQSQDRNPQPAHHAALCCDNVPDGDTSNSDAQVQASIEATRAAQQAVADAVAAAQAQQQGKP